MRAAAARHAGALMHSMTEAVAVECLATAFLLIGVVGSGIMAERLCGGNIGLALLANAIATGGALVALILAFGPRSGAHMNPAVTLAAALTGGLRWHTVPAYITGAYWFTASTSFANPAVTIARALSNTFAGIRPEDAPGFIIAQLVAVALALPLLRRAPLAGEG